MLLGANFSVYMFTMPEKIEVSLKIGSGLKYSEVAKVPVEIPGSRVKALTSAYSIAREINFSLNKWKKELKRVKKAAKL